MKVDFSQCTPCDPHHLIVLDSRCPTHTLVHPSVKRSRALRFFYSNKTQWNFQGQCILCTSIAHYQQKGRKAILPPLIIRLWLTAMKQLTTWLPIQVPLTSSTQSQIHNTSILRYHSCTDPKDLPIGSDIEDYTSTMHPTGIRPVNWITYIRTSSIEYNEYLEGSCSYSHQVFERHTRIQRKASRRKRKRRGFSSIPGQTSATRRGTFQYCQTDSSSDKGEAKRQKHNEL